MIELLIPGLMFVIGGVIGLIGIIIKYKKENTKLEAKCIDVLEHPYSQECPVFQVEYNNTITEVCNNVYSDNNTINIGDVTHIYVNPKDLNSYSLSTNRIEKPFICICYGMIALGLIMCAAGYHLKGETIKVLTGCLLMPVGILLTVIKLPDFIYRMKNCQYDVEAKIVERMVRPVSSEGYTNIEYRYIYEFNYENKTYYTSNGDAYTPQYKEIDTKEKIKICEKNPKIFRNTDWLRTQIIIIFLGLFLIFSAIVLIVG